MSSRLIGMSIVLVTVVAAAACAGIGGDSSSITAPSTVQAPTTPNTGFEPYRFVVFKGDVRRVGGRTPTGVYGYAISTNLAQATTAAENACLQGGGAFCEDLGYCTHIPPSGSANRSWAFAMGQYLTSINAFPFGLVCNRPNTSDAASLSVLNCTSFLTNPACRAVRSGTTN
jgi:hypothetical protein